MHPKPCYWRLVSSIDDTEIQLHAIQFFIMGPVYHFSCLLCFVTITIGSVLSLLHHAVGDLSALTPCSFLLPPLDVFAIGDPNQSTLLAVSVAGGIVLLVFLVTCFVVSGRYEQIFHVFPRVEAVGYLTGTQRDLSSGGGEIRTAGTGGFGYVFCENGWVEHACAQTCGIRIASDLWAVCWEIMGGRGGGRVGAGTPSLTFTVLGPN